MIEITETGRKYLKKVCKDTDEGEDIEIFTLPKKLAEYSEQDQRRIVADFIMDTELKEFRDTYNLDSNALFNFFEEYQTDVLQPDHVIFDVFDYVAHACDEILANNEDECYRTLKQYGLQNAIIEAVNSSFNVNELDEYVLASIALFDRYTKNLNASFIIETINDLIEGKEITK